MTPAARAAAAIEAIDAIRAGTPAEKALTTWARRSRYAGSKDRAAVRDLVFSVLRRWRSTAAEGGGKSGRARLLGLLRQQGKDPSEVFSGAVHAPAPLTPAEAAVPETGEPPAPVRLDLPDWLWPGWQASLGAEAEAVAALFRDRAPVFVRANRARITREALAAELAAEGIETRPHPLSPTALEVLTAPRAIAGTAAFAEGRAELQDAASQAVADALPEARRVLDFCAGGGGKSLALAARFEADFAVHDAAPRRLAPLWPRAERAGARLRPWRPGEGDFGLVLCDVPCSGSGAWRRAPEGKWRLTAERLDALCELQQQILAAAAPLVAGGGTLAYATCSVLDRENDGAVARFLERHSGWHQGTARRFSPAEGGDGLFVALLERVPGGI